MIWKHGLSLVIFSLEFEIFGVTIQCIKTAKNGSFCDELLSENDSDAVLVNFYCYNYGANA